ncbi:MULTISPECIES: ATP-binding protein [unclassified Mesobacillus]|uniref:ATP-binding protein n=1 Tax=unclassified Mesobacillus TaxID=2675270 RepID=UPI00203FC97C|nr:MULTISPECIES: ATP-binding protein [unclassified Mesobacillus]MCM3124714.1 ATP-binding protein [Mesobacillus sp. MER 33]MCM3234576.1 ATP-binding protein [Mesobacillus sp. MER 48]
MKAMTDFMQSQTIRNKVLVFGVAMSTIPLLLISLFYYSFVKADLETRIIEKQHLVLENLSREIEFEFSQTFQRIQVLASLNLLDKKQSALYELLQQSESVEEVVIADDKGFVEQRVSRYDLNIAGSMERWFTDDMWFQLQTRDKVYGQVDFNQYGQPVMKLAIPFYGNGTKKAIGVVVQLQKIIGKISSMRQDHSSYIYLVDDNDRVIAHQDYSKIWHKQPSGGHDEIGVTAKIEDLNWILVMEQPKTTAFAPINRILQSGIGAVALLILTVSLISVWAGLYFTRPIVSIDREMNNLKQGRKISPVKMRRTDELGKLADSFNDMSKELLEKSRLLEQEKERLNVVVNGIGAGLALVTKEYRITWMNPILKGWLKEDRLTLPCYTLIGGENTPCLNCPITCPDLDKIADEVMKFKDGPNGERIFRHRVFPLNHAIEEEGEFLVVLEDITEQKQMEETMIQTDKLSALGIMASSFAHEVNNPLATINVYAEDLIDRIQAGDEDLDEDEMEHYLRKIKENTERCKKITGNLLNFSRKNDWTQEHIHIREIIESSISLVEHQLKKQRIQLELQVPDSLPMVTGDGLKLMQVIVNLINNAVDAMESEGRLLVSASADDEGQVSIKVTDSGHGIPAEAMDKLFDPFFTTKPIGKGTGLGLSVCYGIIQQFGGTITIDSKPEEGTTVEIQLPAELQAGIEGEDQ